MLSLALNVVKHSKFWKAFQGLTSLPSSHFPYEITSGETERWSNLVSVNYSAFPCSIPCEICFSSGCWRGLGETRTLDTLVYLYRQECSQQHCLEHSVTGCNPDVHRQQTRELGWSWDTREQCKAGTAAARDTRVTLNRIIQLVQSSEAKHTKN